MACSLFGNRALAAKKKAASIKKTKKAKANSESGEEISNNTSSSMPTEPNTQPLNAPGHQPEDLPDGVYAVMVSEEALTYVGSSSPTWGRSFMHQREY